jgi:isopenicillin N synthase-like dioxygenase
MSLQSTSQRNPEISLEHVHLEDLESHCSKATEGVIQALESAMGVIIEVPGFTASHLKALQHAQEFFKLSYEEKSRINGPAVFHSILGKKRITLKQGSKRLSKTKADVFGRERGWVPPEQTNSGVLKEYFQFGLELSENEINDMPDWVPNIWPTGAFAKEFKQAKLTHLDLFCRIHRAILHTISSVLAAQYGTAPIFGWPANIICRDTRYLPGAQIIDSDSSVARIRNKPHLDLGESTVIRIADGLQLCMKPPPLPKTPSNDNWVSISAAGMTVDSVLFIPGIALEIRTNGLFKACWHRVVAVDNDAANQERLSIVSFGNAGITDTLQPLKGLIAKRFPVCKTYYPRIKRHLLPLIGNSGYLQWMRSFDPLYSGPQYRAR